VSNNLLDPGAQAPDQIKKEKSCKPQAPSFKRHEKNTIKMYKVIRKE
jgi:hypothetical protein